MDNPFYADTFMNPCGYEFDSFLSFLETHFFITDPNSRSTQTEKLTEDKLCFGVTSAKIEVSSEVF